MNLLTAPHYSLFSVDFYRRVLRSGISQGILYLLYLSALATFLFLVFIMTRMAPQADAFVEWFKKELPPLVWTPEGLVMNAKNPYTMVHPALGPVITFDTSKNDISVESMGEVTLYVTSKKVYAKQGTGDLRVYDLAQMMKESKQPAAEKALDPEAIGKFYQALKPWAIFFIGIAFFPFYFVWKFLAVLFYSGVGALINLSRTSRLPYSAILNLSFFALTASCLIQSIQLLVPGFDRVPFGWLGSVLVTSWYLFLAIKKTEGEGDSFSLPSESSPLS